MKVQIITLIWIYNCIAIAIAPWNWILCGSYTSCTGGLEAQVAQSLILLKQSKLHSCATISHLSITLFLLQVKYLFYLVVCKYKWD